MSTGELFDKATQRFDAENACDPNTEVENGAPQARELLYARRLYDWVLRLNPEASEALRLAARCQHICRWMIPRESYPATRPGYLKWRQDLKQFHARKAGEILAGVGYPKEAIERVQALNLKKDLASDPEMQTLEDALCLVFLEHQFGPLAARSDEEKMIVALQKSWAKMSERGRDAALKLRLGEREMALLQKALGSTQS